MPLYVPQKMQLLLLRRQKKTVKQNFLRLLKIEGKKGANLPWKYFDLLMHFVWMRVCCLEVFFLNGAWKNVVFRKWEKKLFWWKKKKWFITKNLTTVWWWHHNVENIKISSLSCENYFINSTEVCTYMVHW